MARTNDDILNQIIDEVCCNIPFVDKSDFRKKMNCIDRTIAISAMEMAINNAIAFNDIEKCTYSVNCECKLIKDKPLYCNGKHSENSRTCRFYIGQRNIKPATESINNTATDIIGMHKYEAIDLIEARGYTWRITRYDKNDYIITCDLRTDRISIEIDNGIITEAYLG